MTTVEDFLSKTDITGALTPEQAAQVLDLTQEGETAPGADLADAPAPAPAEPAAEPTTTTTTTKEPEPEPEPAILAKDGKHLIPFEKLTEARESAQQAAAERDAALAREAELKAQLEAAKQPPKVEPEKVDLKEMRRERATALLDGDIDKVLELDEKIDAEVLRAAEERSTQRIKGEDAAATAAAQAAAMEQVAKDARVKYPALDHTSDKADAEAIEFVVFKRDSLIVQGETPDKALAQAVASAAKLYRWSDGQPAPAPTPDPKAAAAAAAAAIAAAKTPVPASLSAIPGGKPGGLSALEQLAGKASGPELLEAMEGMSKEQIETFLNRTI